ncbi:MAG: family 10 glycosylhydrolase [Rhodothermales bacterium]|nr:family 10 glycosylhydrolase [Rhodothermales bacterium]
MSELLPFRIALVRATAVLLIAGGLSACASGGRVGVAPGPSDADLIATVPPIPREFRGVWIATVANIDWPSQPGLPVERQKADLRRLLDRVRALNMNAVVFQVRPMSDALYSSPYEPWSYYLTGMQGRAPEPFWDPLAFAVDEAHRRGLELHAWFNPFRAWHATTGDTLSGLHVRKRRAETVVEYGEQTWMDPGSQAAVEHSLAVIMDVVDRYDIDGVHVDDYFYPYPVSDSTGAEVPFPDDASFLAAGHVSGGALVDPESPDSREAVRANWRRSNVDAFIHRMYLGVKARKPWVKVGISPFGIWRPGHPEGVTGFDAWENLYADARRWLREGWADYFSPQLYWSLDSDGQPYDRLLDWWIEQNRMDRHIWPGLFTSRVILDGGAHWDPPEIVRQIMHTRNVPGADGNIHFSLRAMTPAPHGMGETVHRQVYSEPAAIPASGWIDVDPPEEPDAFLVPDPDGIRLEVSPRSDTVVRVYAVHTLTDNGWELDFLPGAEAGMLIPDDGVAVVVRAVGRTGLESRPVVARAL